MPKEEGGGEAMAATTYAMHRAASLEAKAAPNRAAGVGSGNANDGARAEQRAGAAAVAAVTALKPGSRQLQQIGVGVAGGAAAIVSSGGGGKGSNRNANDGARAKSAAKPAAKQSAAKPAAAGPSNAQIADMLMGLSKEAFDKGDKFKGVSFKKAAEAMKAHPVPITSGKEAQKLKGIGKGTATRIDDFIAGKSVSANAKVDANVFPGEWTNISGTLDADAWEFSNMSCEDDLTADDLAKVAFFGNRLNLLPSSWDAEGMGKRGREKHVTYAANGKWFTMQEVFDAVLGYAEDVPGRSHFRYSDHVFFEGLTLKYAAKTYEVNWGS